MTPLKIDITVDPPNAVEALQRFPDRALAGVAKAIDLENELTIGHAQVNYLTGPRPKRLGVVTNRLRLSLSREDAVVVGREVVSAIGTNVAYGGAHEFGVDKLVDVAAHTRHQVSNDIIKGRGRRGFVKRGKRETVLASGFAQVVAHRRHMKMPPRPFIAPSLRDREQDYRAGIGGAIREAWEGGAS